jgi:hypothetical protein
VLSVVLLPNDLFYPVAVESVGVFVKKGQPHNKSHVLWVRLDDDGFIKWKGFRVEVVGHDYKHHLSNLIQVGRNWFSSSTQATDVPGFYEFHKIVGDEIIPQAQMGTPPLDDEHYFAEASRRIRDYVYSKWERVGS